MSEFHSPNDDKSVMQSEALPTMGGDSYPNDGDMNHNDSSNNYEVLANTTSNSHHHPHPEEVAAPWGNNHPSSNMAYNNPHHRAPPPPPPPPHGSYHHHPPHEPHHHHPHHGGYHPPYGSSPHYAYPPHDSHYHPPPPHHPPPPPSHHPSVHHYPPKYSHHPHSSQMYHHPGYYQHPPPPPPPHYHHYPPQHHHQHGMPPHGSYPPPPHYSSGPPQDVSPHNHRDDTHHVGESMPPKQSMNHPTEQQEYYPLPPQQLNMVTPTINSATTPGVTNYSPNTTSPDTNDNATTTQDDIMNSPATKELFASTPHHLSTNPTTTTNSSGGNFNRSGMYKQRKQQQAVHKSILSKGLLPLDYDKNDDLVICGFEDSLLLPVARYDDDDGRVEEEEEEVVRHHDHGGVTSSISDVAATAANTAAQISGGGSTYTSSQSTTSEPIMAGVNGTTNMVTSPHQMEEIKSLSNQARAQIAKMKRMGKKQVQQVESQRVADIACEDNERYASSADESSHNVDAARDGEQVGTRGDATAEQYTTIKTPKKSSTQPQKRYKDKDGFIYYRRVGNKHYKKLFEKGLVPKGDDGDSADDKVVERVNAIQTITTKDGVLVESSCEVPVVHQPDGGEDIGGVLNRRGLEERVEEGDGEVIGQEESMEQEQSLQLPRSRQTQMLYCNQQKRPVNASDGYELRVVPHEDGNDFHVELIKPDAEKVESVKTSAEEKDAEGATSPFSSPSVESEKLSENVEEGAAGGSKKNVGEFVSAVDSILDAAETIAKRDTPRSSPITLPQSQHQQTEDFSLPGISSLTKRKCADMIQGYQEEKRQRSNSSVAFNPCTYTAPSTFSYPPPDTVRPSPPHERVAEPSPQSHAAGPASYSQIICQDRKEKRGRRTYCYPHPSVDLTEYYSSRQVTKTKKEELTALALCAASHIQKEPVLFRAILLNMALERERDSPKRHSGGAPTHLKNLALKRLSSQNLDGSATDTAFMSAVESSGKKVIRDGFFWKDVPELEKVLQTHMMEYYFMSENRPQSKKQQQFNNRLVSLVYQEAIARGFVFDPVSFSLEGHGPLDFPSTTTPIECAGNWIVPPGFNHKKLRDRIRCYYKTHVQNSKKRLGTLLKNPIKERNRDILLRLVNELKSQEHVELSSECVVALKRLKVEQDSIKGTVSTPDGTSPSSYEISSHPSAGYIGDHSQQTTTPYSSRATISDGGSGSSSSTAHSVQTPHATVHQPASTTFSPFKHASLLSSMRQLDSQRH